MPEPSKDAQAELLKNVDVQAFLGIVNDLLTGKKKLVIESVSKPHTRHDGTDGYRVCFDYKHTFRVEDVNV